MIFIQKNDRIIINLLNNVCTNLLIYEMLSFLCQCCVFVEIWLQVKLIPMCDNNALLSFDNSKLCV